MIYLTLSILSSSLIFIVFKWLGQLQMNTLLIIVVNYLVASMLGLTLSGGISVLRYAYHSDWLVYTVILGFGFVGMFYVMARATHISGTASAVVANKMSVIIPVSVAILFLGDDLSAVKVCGIILALIGIFYATKKEYKSSLLNKAALLLLLIFFGSGAVDTSLKLLETYFVKDEEILLFTTVLFFSSFVSGIFILTFQLKQHISSFRWQKIFMGISLGIVNFGSIYFLILALKTAGMQSSILFPINNIGVVVLSTVLSFFLFAEKLSKHNLLGVILSILSLVLLMLD